jgi:hypothetical protein
MKSWTSFWAHCTELQRVCLEKETKWSQGARECCVTDSRFPCSALELEATNFLPLPLTYFWPPKLNSHLPAPFTSKLLVFRGAFLVGEVKRRQSGREQQVKLLSTRADGPNPATRTTTTGRSITLARWRGGEQPRTYVSAAEGSFYWYTLTLISCSAYSSKLKMEATSFSETSVDFRRTPTASYPRRQHFFAAENLKFLIFVTNIWYFSYFNFNIFPPQTLVGWGRCLASPPNSLSCSVPFGLYRRPKWFGLQATSFYSSLLPYGCMTWSL